jgi:hypothetical protein
LHNFGKFSIAFCKDTEILLNFEVFSVNLLFNGKKSGVVSVLDLGLSPDNIIALSEALVIAVYSD